MRALPPRWWVLILLVPLAVAGCTKSRAPVAGTVTVDGKPIETGGIDFVPLEPGDGPIRFGGPVVNGKYEIEASRGPFPGKYRVEITWMKMTGKKMDNGDGGMAMVRAQALPAKYNEKSELTADISSGRNTVDFNLTP